MDTTNSKSGKDKMAKGTMAEIIWKGNMDWDVAFNGNQVWDAEIRAADVPENAVLLKRSENIFTGSVPYMIVPFLICFAAVIMKRAVSEEIFLDLRFLPLSFLIVLAVGLPLHEFIHALCYPKGAKVYIGVSVKQLRAFVISSSPLSRRRYVWMSLTPALTEFVSLIVFLITPISVKWLTTLFLIPMFMGMITPSPDYMDVYLVLRQVPKGAFIQPTEKGYVWYKSS